MIELLFLVVFGLPMLFVLGVLFGILRLFDREMSEEEIRLSGGRQDVTISELEKLEADAS